MTDLGNHSWYESVWNRLILYSSILGVIYSFISILYVLDAKTLITQFSRKSQFFKVVSLIEKILAKNPKLSDDIFLELISEMQELHKSDLMNSKNDGKIDFQSIDTSISQFLWKARNNEDGVVLKDKTVSEIEELKMALYNLKRKYEGIVMEIKNEKND